MLDNKQRLEQSKEKHEVETDHRNRKKKSKHNNRVWKNLEKKENETNRKNCIKNMNRE